MSDAFKQHSPEIKDLKICPECATEIKQGIFIINHNRKKKRGDWRLTECRACFKCEVIYEVIS
jgi:hypothetical protein